MKPRLLIVLNRLVIGGQSIDTIPLAFQLKDQFEILIVHGEKEKDELVYEYALSQSDDISFIKLGSLKRSMNPFNDILSFFRLKSIIKKFNPHIIHTHGSKPGLIGRPAAWIAGVPVIFHTMHGHVFHSYYNRFFSGVIIGIEKMLGKVTTKIIVLGSEQQSDILDKYKIVKKDKTVIIPLGIDEHELMTGSNGLRVAFRRRYGMEDNTTAICIIGRMVPVKNHHLFIDIIIELKKRPGLKARFFIIGDGVLKEELQRKLDIASISWSESEDPSSADVIFTSWVTPIASALHGMDIVTLTSFNEGTPLSIIEAQACKIPVVAVDAGGVKDTFIPGESGILIKEHDAGKLARALEMLIHDPLLRKNMGEKGYIFAIQKYSKQNEVKAFRELYTSSLANFREII